MITCCEIAITLAITNLLSLAIFAGYTLHWKDRTLKLEKKNGHELDRIVKLEKKNGHEQEQINQLTEKIKKLEKKLRGDKN